MATDKRPGVVLLADGTTQWVVIGVAAHDLSPLSRAERDVVARVLRGESNAAVAKARSVSTRTIANQLASAYRKLGVSSRAELAHHVGRPRL